MKRMSIGDATIEVDPGKTAKLYERAEQNDWCQCSSCTNRHIAARHFMPRELYSILERCGALPSLPTATMQGTKKRRDHPDDYRVICDWLVHGRVVEEGSGALELAPGSWIRPEAGFIDASHSQWSEEVLPDEEGWFRIRATYCAPAIFDWEESFRYESGFPSCPSCGHDFRIRGYLRRNSRIPELFGEPEMREALRITQARVLYWFCSGCYQLSWDLVPDKPPFWRKWKRSKGPHQYHHCFFVSDEVEAGPDEAQ